VSHGGGARVERRCRSVCDSWFRWTPFARSVRLLGERRRAGGRIAEVAFVDHSAPSWYRLVIDLAIHRVLRARVVAEGQFVRQSFHGFDRPMGIRPPR
jgi:hypothetical protein